MSTEIHAGAARRRAGRAGDRSGRPVCPPQTSRSIKWL